MNKTFKTSCRLVLAAIFPLFMSLPAHGATKQMTVLTPPDKSWVKSRLISIVVKTDTSLMDSLEISVNGRKQPLSAKAIERSYACFDGIPLYPGPNRIRIIALKSGKKTETRDLTVFLKSDLEATANTPSAEFTGYFFHSADNDKACMICHRIDFKGIDDNTASADKSPCHTCHKKIMEANPFAHGPASVWSCTSCHKLRQESSGSSRLEADSSTCTTCHADSLDNWKSMKTMHGPTAAGDCTVCHDPHASGQKYFLRKSATDLCVTCHDDIITRPHVVSGFSGKGHPVRMVADPLRPGNELSCASCHNPHASNSRLLLNSKGTSEDLSEFCKSCHSF
jgi:predicted CXXCH cytochrome family protein